MRFGVMQPLLERDVPLAYPVAKDICMTTAAQTQHRTALQREYVCPDLPPTLAPMGVGGNALSQLVKQCCPDIQAGAGFVIEYLDAHAGTWQFSVDHGHTWRLIRTDLINRPGHVGLALNANVRLRLLPAAGLRPAEIRMVCHGVPYSHGPANGCYQPYATEERDGCSCTITLALSLSAINGTPPAAHISRPRNKRMAAARTARVVLSAQ